ncbi:MAG TPA: tRNA (guanosine(46)-N7)-methyltransferase TrmB [Chthoniobacterales bacterium]
MSASSVLTGIDIFRPLDLAEIFRRSAPVHIDIGAGAGSFIVEQARRHPEADFLAVERLLGRVRSTENKAKRLALSNLRILRLDGSWVVKHMLPDDSVTCFYLSFPDPWPKRRHHTHRIVNSEFVTAICRALITGGEWRIVTDHEDYFRAMIAEASKVLTRTTWPEELEPPKTDFEKHFLEKEHPIHRARFVKA